jgi:hypothetical protein
MVKASLCILVLLTAPVVLRADDTDFESTWKDPSAVLDLQNNRMMIFLLTQDESVRRAFESDLALELRKKGIQAVAGYAVDPQIDVTTREDVLSALQGVDTGYVMLMRTVDPKMKTMETLVYSVPGSKLLWTGRSRAVNPDDIDDFAESLAHKMIDKMDDDDVIPDGS